jgi:hypothetical protein
MTIPSRPDWKSLEEHLASGGPAGAPAELRGTVLDRIGRELRADRWDRRMARAAVLLLGVGIALNIGVGWHLLFPASALIANGSAISGRVTLVPTPQTVGALAATVAEATDPETASRFARRMVALRGWSPDGEEAAIIWRALGGTRESAPSHGKEG